MTKLKGLSLSVVAIMLIGGCGGSSDSSTATTAADVAVSGAAVDGYLKGATVCLDIDDNGLCDLATEPATSTTATGGYALTLTAAQAALGAPLLVYGGIDVDTQEWFGGRLKASIGSSGTINITPLTTMVESVVSNGSTLADAEQQVATALGLSDATQVNSDPVALYVSNPEVMKAALTVQKIVEVLAKAATTASTTGLTTDKAISDVYASLATAITTVAAAGTTSGMAAIVTSAAAETGSTIDAGVAATAQLIETAVSDTIDVTTDLSDASLFIDATAEAVEATVEAAVTNGDTSAVVDDSATAVTLVPTDPVALAVGNVFAAYTLAITAEQAAEISVALGAQEATAANIAALTVTSTIGTDTAIAALVTAVNAAQLALEIQAVEIYLAALGITGQTDSVLTAINALSGYSDTLTETQFVALLRGTTDVALNAMADELDPPAATIASTFTWTDLSQINGFWTEHYNNAPTIGRGTVTLNNGTLTWLDEVLDLSTGLWIPDINDDYTLNVSTGTWVLDSMTETYTTSADGLTLTFIDGEQVQLSASPVTDLSGQTLTVEPETGLDVTFEAGAEKYNLLFKDVERYELDWMPTAWDPINQVSLTTGYTTIAEYAATGGCVYWKEINATDGVCAQFSLSTSFTGTSGDLVVIDYDPVTYVAAETVVGTWTIANLPGQSGIETISTTISDPTFLEGDEDYKFLTVFNGSVWIGSHNPAGTSFQPDSWDDFNTNDIGAANINAAIANLITAL